MLTKEEKREQYEQLRATLDQVETVFLLANHGLKVNEVNELRSKVRQTEATYRVVKNSVVRLAIEGTPMEGLAPHLVGPNALAFTDGDSVGLAKVIRDFVKDHPALTFQQCYLEGRILSPEEARSIADLPGREELVGKMLFLLQSPIRRLAVALQSPIQKLTTALSQVAEQKQA